MAYGEEAEHERPPMVVLQGTEAGAGERYRAATWRRLGRRAEVLIAAGAIAGVIGRFAIGSLAKQYLPGPLPAGTLLINITGCLIIGAVQTLFLDLGAIRRETQLLLSVGLCGGFTTFSTFSVETIQLLEAGHAGPALAYQGLSLIGGMLAVLAGSGLAHEAHRFFERRSGRRR